MNKIKKNNIVSFPTKLTDVEREIEAIVFAAAEPLIKGHQFSMYIK